MQADVRLLIESYKLCGEHAAEVVLSTWLMESPNPVGGQFKDGGGHEPAGTPDAPETSAPSDGEEKPPKKRTTANRKITERHNKNPGRGYRTAEAALKSRDLDDIHRAELLTAALLGHKAIGRQNDGRSRNAFDTSDVEGVEVSDAKTSGDPHGLAFKDASRDHQYEDWVKRTQAEKTAAKKKGRKPRQVKTYQVVWHRGPKDTAPGLYLVPGIPTKGNTDLRDAGDAFNPKEPMKPIKVASFGDGEHYLQALRDPEKFKEIQGKLRAAVDSIDAETLNTKMRANYREYIKGKVEKQLADPIAKSATVKAVKNNPKAKKAVCGKCQDWDSPGAANRG